MPYEWLKKATDSWVAPQGESGPQGTTVAPSPTEEPKQQFSIRSILDEYNKGLEAALNKSGNNTQDTQQFPRQKFIEPIRTGDAQTFALPNENQPLPPDRPQSVQLNVVGEQDTHTSQSFEMQPKTILKVIGEHEAPQGYNTLYGGDTSKDLTKMTIDDVLALQKTIKGPSTAVGRYQFINDTLLRLKKKLGLTGSEAFDQDLQDRLAYVLLKESGLDDYRQGLITKEEYATNLSKVWASLPVAQDVKGGSRVVKKGESYYAGDGLNKALVSVDTVLKALE